MIRSSTALPMVTSSAALPSIWLQAEYKSALGECKKLEPKYGHTIFKYCLLVHREHRWISDETCRKDHRNVQFPPSWIHERGSIQSEARFHYGTSYQFVLQRMAIYPSEYLFVNWADAAKYLEFLTWLNSKSRLKLTKIPWAVSGRR